MDKKTNKYLLSEDGQREFVYYAFISYKHADMKWGKWVQKGIERYSLPGKLCSELELPERITPIFRDKEDLTGGSTVQDLLLEKLAEAKYLIVICSRHMKKDTKYIDYEIEHFLELGNPSAHILPLIVDGEACSRDPSRECLPPALLNMGDDRPLGITVKDGKKQDAILKLVAAMLKLNLNSLISHEQERKHRQRIRWLTAAVCGVSALSAFMFYEYLQVNQAKMSEENAYAYMTFQNGDKRTSFEQAQRVEDSASVINQDIRNEAKRIQILSKIQTKYMPYTIAGAVNAKYSHMFTSDGEYLLLYDDHEVKKYDLDGNLIFVYDAYEYGNGIETVSSDGIHIVLYSIYEGTDSGTSLWLCNMETGGKMTKLVSSDRYDNSEESGGTLKNVVEAHFSPDGSVVCAFRSGGYFNTNETLPVWESESGKQIASLPGELLGTREEGGNQGEIVEAFEYLSNTVLHWKGSCYHIYYDLEQDEYTRVLITESEELKDFADWNAYGRYFVKQLEQEFRVYDAATEQITAYKLGDGEQLVNDAITCFTSADNLLEIPIADENGHISKIIILDMEKIELISKCAPENSFFTSYSSISTKTVPNSDRLYLVLTGEKSSLLVRFDPSENTFTAVNQKEKSLLKSEFRFIGSYGSTDVLAASGEEGTILAEITGSEMSLYYTEESYSSFADYAALSVKEDGRLATRHNNGIYLYPVSQTGERYEMKGGYDQNADCLHAVSADGSVVARAQNKTLEIWNDGKTVSVEERDDKYNINSIDVNADGSLLTVSTAGSVTVFRKTDADGYKIAASREWTDRGIALVKTAADDRRVLVLSSPNSITEKKWNHVYYDLSILEADELNTVYEQEYQVYAEANISPEQYVSVSSDGKMYADIELYPTGDGTQFLRMVVIRSADTGEILARTYTALTDSDSAEKSQKIRELETYQAADTKMINFSYVTFSGENHLLAGWSSGTWIFNTSDMKMEGYVKDTSLLRGVPVRMENGMLVYPSDGFHVWDTAGMKVTQSISAKFPEDEPGNGSLTREGKVFVSSDENWVLVSDLEQTRIYRTDDWSLCGWVSTCPVEPLFMNEEKLIYDTGTELYQVNF